jgi:sulfur-carrier protein
LQVQVRLGTGLATAAGTSRLRLELPSGATVATLLDQLRAEQPAIAAALDSALPVVRGEHAAAGQELAEGDEVALLIPVAGGCRPSPERSLRWP